MTPIRTPRSPASIAVVARLVLVMLITVPSACGSEPDTALSRGDRLLAAGETDAAIAEYKLAIRQEGRTPEVLLRLGHAYASEGDVDATLQYLRPLLAVGDEHEFQIAAELSEAARVARDRGSPDNMARALEPVLAMGVGRVPSDLLLPLARYYAELSDWNRALPLYLAVLEGEDPPNSAVLETARAFQEVGGCREAIGYFERYLEEADRRNRAEANWEYGSCLFEVSEADRAQGRPADAAVRLDRMIELGVPRNLLDRAHYNRGEIRMAFGNLEEAEADFLAVLELNPVRSGPLVRLAEERIREIRFGVR